MYVITKFTKAQDWFDFIFNNLDQEGHLQVVNMGKNSHVTMLQDLALKP